MAQAQRLAPALTTSVPTPAQLEGDFSHTFNSAGQLVTIGNPFSVSTGPAGTAVRNPFPGNIIENNTVEMISVYAKPGKPPRFERAIKEASRLGRAEWLDLTQQVYFSPPGIISERRRCVCACGVFR